MAARRQASRITPGSVFWGFSPVSSRSWSTGFTLSPAKFESSQIPPSPLADPIWMISVKMYISLDMATKGMCSGVSFQAANNDVVEFGNRGAVHWRGRESAGFRYLGTGKRGLQSMAAEPQISTLMAVNRT